MAHTPSKDYRRQEREQRKREKREARAAAKAEKATLQKALEQTENNSETDA